MRKCFINLLHKLEKMEGSKISIPEIGVNGYAHNKLTAALLLQPLFRTVYDSDIQYNVNSLNRDKVDEVIRLHEQMDSLNIVYICLFGQSANKASKYAIDKWKDSIVNSELFKVIKRNDQVYIPLYRKTYEIEDLKALSSLGVTVMSITNKLSSIFANGILVSHSAFYSVPFINFINNIGFFIDEFIVGEIIYYASIVKIDLKKILLDNLDSDFVRSLSQYFDLSNFTYKSNTNSLNENSDFSDLIGVLNTLPMERIKDFKFNFVRRFLYNAS